MSRNGSGTYTLPAGNPVVTGTTITTTWANTTLNDVASSLTGSVAADGQTPMSGSLNMANNKIISVLDPTLAQDAATKTYVDTADALALLKANNLSDVASATTSRTNLVAAKSGANSDITSLTGLTTPLTTGQGGTGSASTTYCNLTTNVTGTLPVANGGTGAATLSSNAVLLGNGTSALQTIAPSTSGNVLTSNGTTWASTAPTGLGVSQTWQNLTSTRAFSTTYTNSTGKPISVVVSYTDPTSSGTVNFTTQGVTIIGNSSGGSNYTASINIIVPNGATYSAAPSSSGTLSGWWELR